MKKLLVPIVVLALVAVAIPVMADDMAGTTATFSGELRFGAITDFQKQGAVAYDSQKVAVTLAPDEFNTVYLQLRTNLPANSLDGTTYDNTGAATGTFTLNGMGTYVYAHDFYIKSDAGKALGIDAMGVDPVIQAGWFNATSQEWSATGYNMEALDLELGAGSTFQFDVGIMNMVHVLVAYQPTSYEDGKSGQKILADLYGTFGPVSGEVTYIGSPATAGTDKGNESLPTGQLDAAKGVMGVSLKGGYDVSMVSLSGVGSAAFSLDSDAADGAKTDFGLGVSATYNSMVTFGVSANGNDKDVVDLLGVNVGLSPIPTAGVDLGVAYDASGKSNTGAAKSSGDAMLNNIDASVWTMFGASKLRLGYLYFNTDYVTNDTVWTLNAKEKGNGGLYLDLDLPF